MRNSWILALRELKERISTRSFLLMSFIGPLIVLLLTYMLFAFGNQGKQHWKVLITDPSGIMQNKILAHEDKSIKYSFADNYIEIQEFRDAKKLQEFDAMVEINEKVLGNKSVFVFYREKPSIKIHTSVQFHIERRLEERMVEEFTKLTVADYRKIKQPMNVAFRNVYDPYDESADKRGWIGYFFGVTIVLFIFLFGMTILRSISKEKSNRIIEVLLGSVYPIQLMLGKIIGIGIAAIIQFFIWIIIIGIGLFFMREFVFLNQFDATNVAQQIVDGATSNSSYLDNIQQYNEFVSLIFERVQFGTMLSFFALFFVAGYLFYGAFFAAIGATSGSESDGQQFVMPLIFVLLLSLYAGYFVMLNPESDWAFWMQYIPFTAPIVAMVNLTIGFGEGQGIHLYLSLFVLLISAIFMLILAARLYKNGILHFGHRLRFTLLLKWLKRT